jgi:hypothetical protein
VADAVIEAQIPVTKIAFKRTLLDTLVQSTANEWIHMLSEVLKKALDHGGYCPERDPKQLETVRESEAESTYGIDGTERPRQRPRDPEKQQHYDSGKKKRTRSRISLLGESIRAKSII